MSAIDEDAVLPPDEPAGGGAGSPAARSDVESGRIGPNQALYFYGIARARTWRGGRITAADADVVRVRYRDLEAIVRPTTYDLPPLDEDRLMGHQRVLDTAMRRGTVLPAPYGIVFRGRRQLIRMLQDQYVAIDDGLSFLDGHWELRLHIGASAETDSMPELADLAMQLYSELRRHARAAVPFAADEQRLVSAAFLVERDAWIEFVERSDDLGSAHPELVFDVTGPWPAYDFVRIAP
jgi:hypothetical protein